MAGTGGENGRLVYLGSALDFPLSSVLLPPPFNGISLNLSPLSLSPKYCMSKFCSCVFYSVVEIMSVIAEKNCWDC
jgi:hypothetical protein